MILDWAVGISATVLGRFDEAVNYMDTAAKLDPLSPAIVTSVGYLAFLARRMDDALAAQQLALDLDPYFATAVTNAARCHLHKGDTALAVEMFEKGRRMAGDIPTLMGAQAQAYAMNGDHTAARALIETLRQMANEKFVPCTAFALAHIGLGEVDCALNWLELGCDRHELSISGMAVHPAYDSIRTGPRFEALLRRMGLYRTITT